MIAMSLYEQLIEYCASDAYPFHMPGHKRRAGAMQDPFTFDITEIDGFDDLHHASGILAGAQERAAALYSSSETHFLVNGSTAGILSAITACVPATGELLMARNSHKSAYNAAGLRDIRTRYLYPVPHGEINGPVDPADVEQALSGSARPLPQALFLTSPTYDGIVSDVRAIAQIAHRHGVILIVDEAHGAHFGMHPAFPRSSVTLGADIVIHSLHKTLPSLTQTALLHVNGDLADRRKLRSMLSVFQSSSPSYVLMASIDSCIRTLSECGDTLFEEYICRLNRFRGRAHFTQIDLLPNDDPSRILLRPRNMSAARLYALLRDRYHLQCEMSAPSYVLLISSVADTEEGFCRLLDALQELDRISPDPASGTHADPGLTQTAEITAQRARVRASLYEALNAPQETAAFRNAAGLISAEYLYLYPPGIPLLAPGEEITDTLIRCAEGLTLAGYELHGTEDSTHQTIRVMKEETTKR